MTTIKKSKALSLPDSSKFIIVERYTVSQRLHHWIHFIIMIFFFITGVELHFNLFLIGTEYMTQILHFIVGFFLATWDLIFYQLIIFKNKKIKEIFPSIRDFYDLYLILMCKLRIIPNSRYPHYGFYNIETKQYERKYHPAQKILALTNLFGLLIIGSTGIVLVESAFPNSSHVPSFVITLFSLILTPLTILGWEIRYIHFLVYLYFVSTTFVHFILAIIPQNRNLLKGIIFGKERIQNKTIPYLEK